MYNDLADVCNISITLHLFYNIILRQKCTLTLFLFLLYLFFFSWLSFFLWFFWLGLQFLWWIRIFHLIFKDKTDLLKDRVAHLLVYFPPFFTSGSWQQWHGWIQTTIDPCGGKSIVAKLKDCSELSVVSHTHTLM